jgi:mono/diheme cytochrome c family protein
MLRNDTMRRDRIFVLLGCVISSSLIGCKVTPPGRAETAIVQWTKHNITVGGAHDKNPVQSSADSITTGKQTFGFYCVVCHGRDGQNTGVPFAGGMSPPIPSLASTDIQLYSDGQLKWIIKNGISPSGMPASKGTLSDEDMWTIVVYLRHLPPRGSLGEPRSYSEEEYEK